MTNKNKFIQFCVIAEIEGNVNADEVVGNRATIKKFITKEGIYPFVSSRAIKKGIKAALERKGYSIDPFHTQYDNQRGDSGNFVKYVDQDLFGFMIPSNPPLKRKAPVEISYLVSIFPIPVTVEFGGRFPKEGNPIPFEIEQAKFVGKFYGNIYNYIGIVHPKEAKEEVKKEIEEKTKETTWEKNVYNDKNRKIEYYKDKDREKKLKDLLEIILLGNFGLPRSTNQLNQGVYRYVVVAFTKSLKPLPAFVTVEYQKERKYEIEKSEKNGKVIEKVTEIYSEGYKLNTEKIKEFKELLEEGEEIFVIDFVGNLKDEITILKPSQVKENIIDKISEKIDLEDFEYYLKFYE